MKLQELIHKLQKLDLDPDTNVFLSRDPEGNSYHDITEVEATGFINDPGEPFAVHADEIAEFQDDPNFEVAVVFWP